MADKRDTCSCGRPLNLGDVPVGNSASVYTCPKCAMRWNYTVHRKILMKGGENVGEIEASRATAAHWGGKKIAFDFDGVLTKDADVSNEEKICCSEPRLDVIEKVKELNKDNDVAIVTGRDKTTKRATLKWLKRYGLEDIPVFFNPSDMTWAHGALIKNWKLEKLEEMGADLFIEDNPDIVSWLSGMNARGTFSADTILFTGDVDVLNRQIDEIINRYKKIT